MDLLASEQVAIDSLTGHGGLFKTPGVGQKYMAAACGAPVTVMESAGEGGPYGMALLAAFVLQAAARRWRTSSQSMSSPMRPHDAPAGPGGR